MRVEGRVAIASPRDRVWAFLTSPDDIAGCAPGLESWTTLEPARAFRLVGALPVGGSQGTLRLPATITWTQLDPPRRLETIAELPFAGSRLTVTGNLDLVAHPDASTHLNFTLEAQLTAGVAPPARRLVANVMPGLVERFFTCFKERLEATVAPPP